MRLSQALSRLLNPDANQFSLMEILSHLVAILLLAVLAISWHTKYRELFPEEKPPCVYKATECSMKIQA